MSPSWNERRLERRAKAGDGRPLKPFRWWQMLRRSVLSIDLEVNGRTAVHTVEVKHGGDSDSVVRARLYVDNVMTLSSRLPARFPVAGGHIEVRTSQAGMRRCHFVTPDGREQRLRPDPKSAEGRRMRFAAHHPRGSAFVGAVSVIMLVVGVVLGALQVAGPISEIPAVAQSLGVFKSPVRLPVGLNVLLGLGAAAATIERGLRMQYHWLLDSAGT